MNDDLAQRACRRRGRFAPKTFSGHGSRWSFVYVALPKAIGWGVQAVLPIEAVAIVDAMVVRRMAVIGEALAKILDRVTGHGRRWRTIATVRAIGVGATVAGNARVAFAVGIRRSVAGTGLTGRTIGVGSTMVAGAVTSGRAEVGHAPAVDPSVDAPAVAATCKKTEWVDSRTVAIDAGAGPGRCGLRALDVARAMVDRHTPANRAVVKHTSGESTRSGGASISRGSAGPGVGATTRRCRQRRAVASNQCQERARAQHHPE